MKPLYKWPGGKSREIPVVEKYLPERFKAYVEPFFGGGSVFFHLEPEVSFINEINQEVTNFLHLIQEGRGQEIYNALTHISNDENTYYKIRAWQPEDRLEQAVRFYYMRKTCFRGMMRYNSSGGFNVPYGNYKTYNFEELLNPEYQALLSRATIMTKDYKEVFAHCDDKDDFCFLDPPYHNTFSNYTSDGFDDNDHKELADFFKTSKMKCLMIIGKTILIENLYRDYIVEEYGKKYSITRTTEKKKTVDDSFHLVVKNY